MVEEFGAISSITGGIEIFGLQQVWSFSLFRRIKEMFFFTLIILGVYVKKRHHARRVIMPLVCREISKCGLTPLPIILFLSSIIGFLVVGQSVVLLRLTGEVTYDLVADILVLVIFKEIGPLLAALVLLVRVGVSTVAELAGERASGQMEGLFPGDRPGALLRCAAYHRDGRGDLVPDHISYNIFPFERVCGRVFFGRALEAVRIY